MKKISFWIVIFICMADAALAVTQEGGLFYLPEDTTTQHKDSTVQKKIFFKRFLDYFNDANKDKNHKKFDFSIIGDTLQYGYQLLDWWRRGFIVPIEMTCFFLRPMCLYSEMFPLLASYMLGIRGTHIFPQDKYRLDYTLYFYSFPSKFWGIGYDMGNVDANESDLDRWKQLKLVSCFG